MSSFNVTSPLPRINKYNNKVYDHVPRESKRVKSLTYPKPPSSPLSRTNSIKSMYRRKRSSYLKSSPAFLPPLSINQSSYISDSEFSFTSESSDSESLPDLVDDVTPMSSPYTSRNPSTPSKFFSEAPIFHLAEPLLAPKKRPATDIFQIPEIVHKIIGFAAVQNDNSPREAPTIRRAPLSYNHALLIHGSTEEARKSMQSQDLAVYTKPSSVLFNCLQVNRLFYNVTKEILSTGFYFEDENKFNNYVEHCQSMTFKPKEFKLHKLFHARQASIEKIINFINFSRLEAFEFFMCPKLVPTIEFFQPMIKKIIMCGSKVADDQLFIHISKNCLNLEVLDIRGSELISDHGIYNIGQNCRKLRSINFGRRHKGNLITDNGLSVLINNNPNLHTVGLAGCHISDKTIWDLAIHCSFSLQRLSLNNCPFVTNQSLPLILHGNYLGSLNVLELRFTAITNLKPMIEFKRRQEFKGIPMLIELCEELCLKMRQQELEVDRAISQSIFKDIQDWANQSDDEDADHESLLSSRTWSFTS